jgi:mono/diheme cytochrome c family protein
VRADSGGPLTVQNVLAAGVMMMALGVYPALEAAEASLGTAEPNHFFSQHCLMCHSQKLHTAGVVLEGIDFSHIDAAAPVLERALRKVRTGEMPPPGIPRPPAEEATAFVKTLEAALDRAAAEHPNPGRPAIHRLNRAEYSNAIRDLLALDINAGDMLPVDDSGYGFDNIADVLSVSPVLLERYLSAARKVARLAVGDLSTKPVIEEFTPARTPGSRQRYERVSDDLPFDSAGGMVVRYYFPLDAEYVIRVKFPPPAEGELGRTEELRLPVRAGLRTLGVTFLRESTKPEIEAPSTNRRGATPSSPPASLSAEVDIRLDGAQIRRFQVQPPPGALMPNLEKVVIAGPYHPTGRGETPSRARIFSCRPATAAQELPCARSILTTLARRAFRRPLNDADVRPLLAFYESGRREGDFDDGIQKALRALLVSPDFIFRIEHDPANLPPGAVYRISDLELASRLSFFLWSSIPDDALLNLAQQGKLKDPAILDSQVRRMLADPRSDALVQNFAGQWLSLRNLAVVKPDPDVFPEFDDSLRQSFLQETQLFFAHLLREDCSILELLDANYSFLNQRLAEHYGVSNVYGSQFRKVALSDPNRGGLLGQGSILTVTSYPNRTSVVQRGKWILETLLGTPPPPPPPDIPQLKAEGKDGRLLTAREQMEQHRQNPVCASCHARMDPLGFAMENFDGVGRWRTRDAGSVINASGKLPDGTAFTGPAELKKALAGSHSDEFINTVVEKLLTYALGRGLEYYDKPAVRSITRAAARDNYRMSALISAIVKSTPFQMRRTPVP